MVALVLDEVVVGDDLSLDEASEIAEVTFVHGALVAVLNDVVVDGERCVVHLSEQARADIAG
jgi:hypothetical protein